MAKECSSTTCSKESCEGCPSKQQHSFQEKMNEDSRIGRVIGIISGKGGVGKSLVTASIANQLCEQGFKVGILDADITGPSIPKMYGIKGPAKAGDRGIEPIAAENGIKIMSINLLLPNADDPVIWRGPVIANMVKQFWTDVIWGELDFLLVDMPPGTGDVPLTVFQSLPVNGVVVVTSPQDLVKMIVKKAVKMAEMMKVPVLGIVENYSYAVCPDCGKAIPIFGESQVDQVASAYGLPVLGKVPVHPEYAKAADEGKFHTVSNQHIQSILG
ncbi:Mrp/NBP35 family ATP-binding protein [Ruminococcus sp. OA3]|uniref:Mrp/NBP35 family ATP-binding protein n=1 Tax=Ruminococcus sp. OA3 TaxID=2914164 RepID=UPI001F060C02|nr:Mrp/NBP35 family ATP-binding protein [Ruminococcus sp. OA3]MCH1982402.1 Mrp/NBP35 family ATP-binding protein [Ruminococcus sp. OA3]